MNHWTVNLGILSNEIMLLALCRLSSRLRTTGSVVQFQVHSGFMSVWQLSSNSFPKEINIACVSRLTCSSHICMLPFVINFHFTIQHTHLGGGF